PLEHCLHNASCSLHRPAWEPSRCVPPRPERPPGREVELRTRPLAGALEPTAHASVPPRLLTRGASEQEGRLPRPPVLAGQPKPGLLREPSRRAYANEEVPFRPPAARVVPQAERRPRLSVWKTLSDGRRDVLRPHDLLQRRYDYRIGPGIERQHGRVVGAQQP